jgi:hypothetical protein
MIHESPQPKNYLGSMVQGSNNGSLERAASSICISASTNLETQCIYCMIAPSRRCRCYSKHSIFRVKITHHSEVVWRYIRLALKVGLKSSEAPRQPGDGRGISKELIRNFLNFNLTREKFSYLSIVGFCVFRVLLCLLPLHHRTTSSMEGLSQLRRRAGCRSITGAKSIKIRRY